jgi:hypothetical protein
MKTTSAVDVLLTDLDHAWEHPWESVASSLEGVDEEMAAWQPAAYKTEPPESDMPAPGSIRWHIVHLALCKQEYAYLIVERPKTFEGTLNAPTGSLEELKSALQQAHTRLRKAILSLKAENLGETTGRKISVQEFVVACTRHDIWHAAQIKMVQRLWKQR